MGTRTPHHEFLHADDCADALVFLMRRCSDEGHVNVGSGTDVTIRELATTIMDVVGFSGALETGTSKADGTPRKLMSAARLGGMGWRPRIGLRDGLESVYRWYLDNAGSLKQAS